MAQKTHIYDGYRVLDMTHMLAGPAATRVMAELGAEIIKIELMPNGDGTRAFPYIKDGRSAYFIQQNRGKKSVCLNHRDPRAIEIIKALIPRCDVMTENFAVGVIERMGLGYDVVKEINPAIVMCSVTAFGRSGPLADLPGFDFIGAAYAGVLDMIGHEDGPPLFPMLAMGDVGTGVHALAAINSALLYRKKTNEGQYIECSLLDTYFHQHEVNVQIYSGSGGKIRPKRTGQHHNTVQLGGIYKGTGPESWLLLLAFTPKHWEAFCRHVIEREDLMTDPRFATAPDRLANVTQLAEIVQAWVDAQESDEAILAKFHNAHVPAAPVLTVPEAMEHPHLVERETVRTVHDRAFGELQIPGVPLRFSKYNNDLPLDAPFLGEHTREVLREHLGYSDAKIDALAAEGVIKTYEPEPAVA
jgi:crotonobetainyl-CoA:carnitine CoA-transferase CaiB-like acyl-CoA transferase